jgi:hypothetical protein
VYRSLSGLYAAAAFDFDSFMSQHAALV